MQTLPGTHHRGDLGLTNPLKALRATVTVVVELTPEAGARAVTDVGGTPGGARLPGVAVKERARVGAGASGP